MVVVKVNGDSMEMWLFNKDIVVVDMVDMCVLVNGGVFVLVYVGELLVKCLFRLLDGGFKIVSDNVMCYVLVDVGLD